MTSAQLLFLYRLRGVIRSKVAFDSHLFRLTILRGKGGRERGTFVQNVHSALTAEYLNIHNQFYTWFDIIPYLGAFPR